MPQGLVKPSNQVVVAGNPLKVEMEIGANASTDCLPGRLVIFDTVDFTVVAASAKADNVVGFLGSASDKLEATQYAAGDEVQVIMGECIAKLLLLASENVARGDPLVAANNGKVAKQAVGAMAGQGSVIGWALESSNVTVDAEILVFYSKTAEPAAVS